METQLIYRKLREVKEQLRAEIVKGCPVDENYFQALRFLNRLLDEIIDPQPKNNSLRKEVATWLRSGKTTDLKHILHGVGYLQENLVHFNAMARIDAVYNPRN